MTVSNADNTSEDEAPNPSFGPEFFTVFWAIVCLVVWQSLLQIVVFFAYLSPGRPELSESHQVSLYATVTFLDLLAMFGIGYYFGCRKPSEPFRDGFLIYSVPRSAIFWAVFSGFALIACNLLVGPVFLPVPENPVWQMSKPAGAIVFAALLLIRPAVVVLFFQGFIYRNLSDIGEFQAYFTVIGVYALQHSLSSNPLSAMIPPAITAAVLTYLTHRYDSVIPAFVALTLHNLILAVLLGGLVMTGN